MQVLFVDDDEVVSQSVKAVLGEKGHVCETADLGASAIALAKDNEYDVIVLDVGLPDMDGYHVIRRLKMEGIKTPVVLQSGLAGEEQSPEGPSLGITQFLTKPFSVSELIERIELVVGQTGAGQPAPSPAPAAEPAPRPAPPPEPQAQAPRQPAADGAERRRAPRVAAFEAALITDEGELVPCAIVNISETGAALRVSLPEQKCPTLFTLRPLDGPERRCEVRWRREDQIGVEFTGQPAAAANEA
jgi:DNA-binding response OmpR family regulator